jgi:hypothetical protein
MPLLTHDRLQYSFAVLRSLDARRTRTGDPYLHQQLEKKLIARELEELAQEWTQNPPPSESNAPRAS